MAREAVAPYFQEFKGPTDFVVSSLERPGTLGQIFRDGKRVWQLVQLSSNADTAAVAKDLLYWEDVNTYKVSTTAGDTGPSINHAAGVTAVAIPVGSYAWIQIQGKASVKAGAGTHAEDMQGLAGASNAVDVGAAATTAPVRTVIGQVLAAASGGFVDVNLTLQPAA